MIDRNDLERLKRLLAPGGQRIAVVAHTNPDGDAIGSAWAMRCAARCPTATRHFWAG